MLFILALDPGYPYIALIAHYSTILSSPAYFIGYDRLGARQFDKYGGELNSLIAFSSLKAYFLIVPFYEIFCVNKRQ